MTQAELAASLRSLGMPVAYGEFISTPGNPAPPPPFITYQFDSSGDIFADNQNAIAVDNFLIELYTNKKDLDKEGVVQDKLKELNLPYSKTETYLESEKMRQGVYEIQLIGG